MGTVRREGDWRLEKKGEGIYEITFRKETQERIITSDASPSAQQQSAFDFTSVTRVSSYSEAEGLFEERIHGPPPLGMSYSHEETSASGDSTGFGDDLDFSEVPPVGWGIVLLIGGAVAASMYFDMGNSVYLYAAIALILGGIGIFGYAGHLFREEGLSRAWSFLAGSGEFGGNSRGSTEETKKTPPAPEKLKNELYFERANRSCEWCEERIDQPDVHHITPRSEGGSNRPNNLIVLCPTCHRRADRGAISRSKLRYRIETQ